MAINLESTPSYKRYTLVVSFYCWWPSPEVLTADSVLFAKFNQRRSIGNISKQHLRLVDSEFYFGNLLQHAQSPISLELTFTHNLSRYHASDSGGHNLR